MQPPFEPSGDARKTAGVWWNQYRALLDVGFTPDQAIQILNTQVAAWALMNRAN